MKKFLFTLTEFITHNQELAELREALSRNTTALQTATEALHRNNVAETHVIALARLTLIKPSTLYREVSNTEANLDYLQQLIEAKAHADKDLSN